MGLFDKLTNSVKDLKDKAEDRLKANGGLEGIIQKTTEKVDKLAGAAGETIKKATDETKDYIQDAKVKSQESGKEGLLGVVKTLGSKVTTDVSSLVQTGYQKVVNSEVIQDLKKELSEEEGKTTSSVSTEKNFDYITSEQVLTAFFSAVKQNDQFVTASQPNNPKNEKLVKRVYILNGNQWFNPDSGKTGDNAFSLILDFLAYQTKLDLNDKNIFEKLSEKALTMLEMLHNEIQAEKAKPVEAKKVKDDNQPEVVKKATPEVKSATKKPAAKKTTTVKKETEVVNKTVAAKKTPAKKPSSKPTASVKSTTDKPAVKKTPAKKTSTKKPDTE